MYLENQLFRWSTSNSVSAMVPRSQAQLTNFICVCGHLPERIHVLMCRAPPGEAEINALVAPLRPAFHKRELAVRMSFPVCFVAPSCSWATRGSFRISRMQKNAFLGGIPAAHKSLLLAILACRFISQSRYSACLWEKKKKDHVRYRKFPTTKCVCKQGPAHAWHEYSLVRPRWIRLRYYGMWATLCVPGCGLSARARGPNTKRIIILCYVVFAAREWACEGALCVSACQRQGHSVCSNIIRTVIQIRSVFRIMLCGAVYSLWNVA